MSTASEPTIPSQRTRTLSEAVRSAIESRLVDAHVAMPGRIVTYDDGERRASVQPLIKRGYVDENSRRVAERLPVIPGVPVIFPGSGGRRIFWDVLPGDTVLLVFASASLDKWLATGGEVDPLDDRHHSLADAVALLGLDAFPDAADAATTIGFVGSEIRVGGSESLALGSALQALLDAIDIAITSSGDTGPGSLLALKNALSNPVPAGVDWTSLVTAITKGA